MLQSDITRPYLRPAAPLYSLVSDAVSERYHPNSLQVWSISTTGRNKLQKDSTALGRTSSSTTTWSDRSSDRNIKLEESAVPGYVIHDRPYSSYVLSYLRPASFASDHYAEYLLGRHECLWRASQSLQYDRRYPRFLFTDLEGEFGNIVSTLVSLVLDFYFMTVTEGDPIWIFKQCI